MTMFTDFEISEIDELWSDFLYNDDDLNYDQWKTIGHDWRRLYGEPLQLFLSFLDRECGDRILISKVRSLDQH